MSKEKSVEIKQKSRGGKIKGVADIILLIDATESMKNCIDELKNNIKTAFIEKLGAGPGGGQTPLPKIDWRARVIPFRDVEADGDKWIELSNDFVSDEEELKKQLSDLNADGGGDFPESGLDAVYMTLKDTKSKWREKGKAHRFIILFSDADSKPVLHDKIKEPNEAADVNHLQHLVISNLVKLFGIVPECEVYRKLFDKLPRSEVYYVGQPGEEKTYEGLKNQNFQKLLEKIAATVTQSATQPEKA